MKSKKLLISLLAVAMVVVVIVVLAAVLTVKNVYIVYHGFDGTEIGLPDEGIAENEVSSAYKGKSIVFLSKTRVMEEMNEKYNEWHAFAIVKQFPNVVEIHVVGRVAVAKFSAGGNIVYVDSFGYPASAPADGDVIDISSAFSGQSLDIKSNTPALPFQFQSEISNTRLGYTLQSILATWQCMVEISDMQQVLGTGGNVFTFNESGDLVISPKTGGRIVVQSPETDLSARLIKAYGVYYNKQVNLQNDDYTITVHKNGKITTPSK